MARCRRWSRSHRRARESTSTSCRIVVNYDLPEHSEDYVTASAPYRPRRRLKRRTKRESVSR
jgi:hypothetical protein